MDMWSDLNVTPKFKKSSPSDPANYRPISLTCTCCKVLESIKTSQILQFLSDHHRITQHQHGFLARHSTTTNLLECTNDWTISISNHKSIIIAYVDFEAAFDCISHHKRLLKLSSYGIRDNLLVWKINQLFSPFPNTYTIGHSLRIKIPLAKSNVSLHFFHSPYRTCLECSTWRIGHRSIA